MAVHVVLLTERRPSFEAITAIHQNQSYPLVFIYQVSPEINAAVEKEILEQDLPNYHLTRDAISTVFAPQWDQCPTVYIPLQQLAHNDEWTVFICEADKANNIDYYTHLSSFQNKRYVIATDDIDSQINAAIMEVQSIRGERATAPTSTLEEIRSPLILSHWSGTTGFTETASEVIRHGIRHLRLFLAGGYHEYRQGHAPDIGQLPGFATQVGSHWLTRLFDVFKIIPHFSRKELKMEAYTPEEVTKGMRNPYHKTLPDLPRDNRMEIVETANFRFLLVEGTLKVLVSILFPLGVITPELVRQHGGWTSLALWESINI